MGNVHRSGNFCDFNFSLVGSEEISKVFLKREDACKGRRSFLWNFKFRSPEGAGLAAAGPAAAFAEPEYQIGMHAAAALVDGGELGGAETADSYFLNSLHGEFAAIFHGDLGRAAATEGEFFLTLCTIRRIRRVGVRTLRLRVPSGLLLRLRVTSFSTLCMVR